MRVFLSMIFMDRKMLNNFEAHTVNAHVSIPKKHIYSTSTADRMISLIHNLGSLICLGLLFLN